MAAQEELLRGEGGGRRQLYGLASRTIRAIGGRWRTRGVHASLVINVLSAATRLHHVTSSTAMEYEEVAWVELLHSAQLRRTLGVL